MLVSRISRIDIQSDLMEPAVSCFARIVIYRRGSKEPSYNTERQVH
jgi:hypothetical protein